MKNTEGTLCFICKQENETLSHFLFVCTSFRRHFDSLWANLISETNKSNPTDGAIMSRLYCLKQLKETHSYRATFSVGRLIMRLGKRKLTTRQTIEGFSVKQEDIVQNILHVTMVCFGKVFHIIIGIITILVIMTKQ